MSEKGILTARELVQMHILLKLINMKKELEDLSKWFQQLSPNLKKDVVKTCFEDIIKLKIQVDRLYKKYEKQIKEYGID